MEDTSITVTGAEYTSGYSIKITFSDNTTQTINFELFLLHSPLPEVNKYLDKGKFKRFSVEDGNLNWKHKDLVFPVSDLHSGKIS